MRSLPAAAKEQPQLATPRESLSAAMKTQQPKKKNNNFKKFKKGEEQERHWNVYLTVCGIKKKTPNHYLQLK